MRILFIACLVLLAADAFAQQAASRIRVVDQGLARLVERGRMQSPTFQHLTDDLDAADWLIFIQPGRCPDRLLTGCLLHNVGVYEGRRYLRLLVSPEGRHPDVVIATIAHELQHAYEVVSDGTVTDNETLSRFTRRIASDRYRVPKAVVYETNAARRVGDLVLQELQGRRRERTE